MTLFIYTTLLLVFMVLNPRESLSQPQPGDVFREYYWYNRFGDAGNALRVGGNLDYGGRNIDFDNNFDLLNATRAELIIEKIQSHATTYGLSISINDTDWIKVPFPDGLISNYMHHFYPVIDIPLDMLNQGEGNVFKLKVNENNPSWPQNLINGVHVRVYYDATVKSHPTGRIVTPSPGTKIDEEAILETAVESDSNNIRHVDFVGLYEDVNFEGDGVYYQWHYHYLHGKIMHHIDSAMTSPYKIIWNTTWLPDQPKPMKISARIVDTDGMIYMTEAVGGLSLGRDSISVELCKPYNVSRDWVTRKDNKGENFRVDGDLAHAVGAQIVWSSWSPGYMNGIFINGEKVFDNEGPKYRYDSHRINLESPDSIQQGENRLTTGLTPLYNGKMVHGMEVQWPGIMVLIKYENIIQTFVGEYHDIATGTDSIISYPNPFNTITTIRYTLTDAAPVSFDIVSLSGQTVRKLINDHQDVGTHELHWDGRDADGNMVASGIYIGHLSTGDKTLRVKMQYMR